MVVPDERAPLNSSENERYQNIPTLPLIISGVHSPSVHTLLFVHGYPDDERLFRKQVEFFSRNYRVACVRLPWFSTYERAEQDAERYGHNRQGYTIPELAEALANATDSLSATVITVIGHDWGAIVAQLTDIKYPGIFHSMVALDVGLSRWVITRKAILTQHVIFLILYSPIFILQIALFYLMYEKFPRIARSGINAVVRFVTWLTFWERPGIQEAMQDVMEQYPSRGDVHPLSGYSYYDLIRAAIACLFRNDAHHHHWVSPEEEPINWVDFPSCPILFMYGKSAKGGFLLHDLEWENKIKERIDGSAVVCYDDGGHWFFVEKANQCNTAIQQWLDKLILNGFV